MTAGSSGTPLVRKLGVKAGYRLKLVGAPEGWGIEGLPGDVVVSYRRGGAAVDIIIAFFRDVRSLRRHVPQLAGDIVANGALWVGWPRRAGGHTSDITDNAVRAVILPLGLVDVKIAAHGQRLVGHESGVA